jgi:hypothetical protein
MRYNGEEIGSWILRHGRRLKAPGIAVSTQWDSVPRGRESTTINSAHTTTAKYHTHTQLWKRFHPSYSPLLLIRWGASQVEFVFRLISQKKWSHGTSPQNRRFYFGPSPLASVDMWKEYNICQSIWVKGEVLWRICWGIRWGLGEHIGNLKGTQWEPGKTEKKSSSNPPSPNLKGKNARHFESVLGPSHWLHEISLPKRVLAWALSLRSPTFFCCTWLAHGQKNWNYPGSPK